MDLRIRKWRCPECGQIVAETDYGYPSPGDLCWECREPEVEEDDSESVDEG